MNYESEDRLASSYVCTSVLNGVRFYLTEDGLYSDMLKRARIFRWHDEAMYAGIAATSDHARTGGAGSCHWEPILYIEARNTLA